MKRTITTLAVILTVTFSLTTQKSEAMEKKKVEKIAVLKYTLQSSIATLTTDVGNTANEMVAKATELGLEVTGPQIWQYNGSDGKPDTKFTLDICIPIKEAKGNAGKFEFAELPEFNCISEIHKGPWDTMMNTYQRILGEMSRKGMMPGYICREIYVVSNFVNQEGNVTEIQMQAF